MAVELPKATGQQVTLAEVKAMVESLDLPPKAQSRFENWAAKLERDVRAKQTGRYAEDAEDLKRERDNIVRESELLTEAARQIGAGLADGSIPVEAGRRDLTKIFADLNKLRPRLKQLRKNDEDAWAEVTKDPAEWHAAQVARFPGLRNTLPTLTPDVFDHMAED